ncbi:kinase-like protein [Hygrophoropsis aurantiaca]|uniref:Kinase-like protein n=1 Tax=Hygrophoropsis aurantiaca TaxID=72124 RepID=A0ACB8A7W9_9AGAM|nr:kinase-like protein [Hygrophoropsis aurantiaca]
MVDIEASKVSPVPHFPPTLADLSRNASVISSSSDSESAPPHTLLKSPRPRPMRTFSSPRSTSPQSPTSTPARPPAYLTRELAANDENSTPTLTAAAQARSKSRNRSKSQNRSANSRLSAADFAFGETLGEGSYSTVMRATYLRTGQEYAIKILDKNHLMRKEKMHVALAEKNALVKLGAGHPGIVHLHWTFQDDWSLFFVLDLATNGEMQTRISRLGSLSLTCSRYYAAQIVDAVDYIHTKDVIHRDLKPENLLLDNAYRIKITDFGTAKIIEPSERANTFVGTAQYVSPELLEKNETSKSSDLWAIGCIIYQMIAGRFAFQGLSEYLTWQKIKSLDYSFPDGFDPDAKDLVERLFARDPLQRLGAGLPGGPNGPEALRSHPFFASISWSTLWTDPVPPLEAGLVKRELPIAGGADRGWDDVGATWDSLVESTVAGDADENDVDGLGWAPDAEGAEFERFKQRATGVSGGSDRYDFAKEEGPMGEMPDYAPRAEEDTTTIIGHAQSATIPIRVPDVGTVSSSSEGSPGERLGTAMDALELSRGRNRSETPIQGHGPSSDTDWSSVLLPGEKVLFNTRVEARSPKRRGSRLRLPLSVSPMRPKTRQLLLTTHRLLCLKQRGGTGGISIKSELALQRSDKGKEKEKDSRSVVESAEAKGEKEFVVLTSTRSQTYAAETSSLAATWVGKINAAVELLPPSNPPQPRT